MEHPVLHIRPAVLEDSLTLLEWRNDPQTRENSLTTEEVSLENHHKWFTGSLQREDRVIYVAEAISSENHFQACGMCRFDISQAGKTAVVSINLSPKFRGQGLSLPILQMSITEFSQSQDQVNILEAEIKVSNQASISIFTKAGFKQVSQHDGVGRYSLKLF